MVRMLSTAAVAVLIAVGLGQPMTADAQASQSCGGPTVTATTTDPAGFADIFADYAHSHASGDTEDWIGGDTDYSVTLPGTDGRRVWDFTDPQFGTINSSGGIADNGTSHNAAVLQAADDGALTATLHSETTFSGTPPWYRGWIPEPSTADNTTQHTPFYNPLAMTVEPSDPGSTSNVLRAAGIFGGYSANDENFVATFSLPSLALQTVVTFPAPQPGTDDLGITWGDALIKQGGYTYVYGRNNPQTTSNPLNFVASAYLARVPDGQLDVPADWAYFTGLNASGTPIFVTGAPDQARPIISPGPSYPCETGVVPAGAGYSAAQLGGRFYVFTRDPNSTGAITAYSAASPWGPYTGPAERDPATKQFGFYTMQVPSGAGTCQKQGGCAYGPHIHADVAADSDGWLLSYDVNSTTLGERDANASLYWPRYLRVQVSG